MLGANAYSWFVVGLCIFTDPSNIFLINNIFSSVKLLFSSFVACFWSNTWLQISMLPRSQFQKENQSCIMKGENQTVLFEFIILGFSNLNELKFLLFFYWGDIYIHLFKIFHSSLACPRISSIQNPTVGSVYV